MKITRYLKINTDEARRAVLDKDRLEAFAFAIVIKNNFASSLIKADNALITNLMKLLSVGHGRALRVLKNAIELGYAKKDGECIVANKIWSDVERRKKIQVTEKLNLKQGIDLVRKMALIGKIADVDYFNDLKNLARKELREKGIDSAKRTVLKKGLVLVLNRKAKSKHELDLTPVSISMNTLSNVIGMSIPSTRKILNSMVESGLITRDLNFEEFDTGTDYKNIKDAINHKHEIKGGERLRLINGRLYFQLANIYSIIGTVILLSYH